MRLINLILVAVFIAQISTAQAIILGQNFSATTSGCAGGSDGQIGYATVGGSTSTGTASLIYYSYFTPTEDGTVTRAHDYKQFSTGVYRVGLWSSSGVLLASTAEGTTSSGDWEEIHTDLDTEYCLESGVTYILGTWRTAAWSGVRTSASIGGGNNAYYQVMSTFGDFTPSDTVRESGKALTVTLNNSVSTY